MIIVQTPLRVSLFGGGTDFPAYYEREGGRVLSMAIDKYIFVTVKKRFDEKLRVGYTRTEMVDGVEEVQHELIREALKKVGVERGVEITTMGDIPSQGSGLGSSSTVTVGVLHALYTLLGEIVPAERLAREAVEIELGALGKPIGVQDQYIAAYGGLRELEFREGGEVEVKPVEVGEEVKRRLNEELLLYYTGKTRKAAGVLEEQRKQIGERLEELRELKGLAEEAQGALERGEVERIGELLDEGWKVKKRLASGISNGELDAMYGRARRAGALGGKITGAGGGGFLLLYCPHEVQGAVREAMGGLQELPFRIEPDGTKVIFNYRR